MKACALTEKVEHKYTLKYLHLHVFTGKESTDSYIFRGVIISIFLLSNLTHRVLCAWFLNF